jgi:hypothetical protein
MPLKQVPLIMCDVILVQLMLTAQAVHICLHTLEVDTDQG